MDKVIIEVPSLSNKENIVNGSIASGLIIQAYKNGIFIPKNATNGDVIMAMFPTIDTYFSNVVDMKLWWNAPYKINKEREDKE
jgi:hypothetical protein